MRIAGITRGGPGNFQVVLENGEILEGMTNGEVRRNDMHGRVTVKMTFELTLDDFSNENQPDANYIRFLRDTDQESERQGNWPQMTEQIEAGRVRPMTVSPQEHAEQTLQNRYTELVMAADACGNQDEVRLLMRRARQELEQLRRNNVPNNIPRSVRRLSAAARLEVAENNPFFSPEDLRRRVAELTEAYDNERSDRGQVDVNRYAAERTLGFSDANHIDPMNRPQMTEDEVLEFNPNPPNNNIWNVPGEDRPVESQSDNDMDVIVMDGQLL